MTGIYGYSRMTMNTLRTNYNHKRIVADINRLQEVVGNTDSF